MQEFGEFSGKGYKKPNWKQSKLNPYISDTNEVPN